MSAAPGELRCSFCNKGQRYVRKLVAGPNGNICDECVDICLDIISQEKRDRQDTAPSPEPPGHIGYAPTSPLFAATACSLCRMGAPVEHLLAIHGRGALCPGCIGAIEAAVAASREENQSNAVPP